MKNVTTSRLFNRLASSTILVIGVVSASYADDVNLKTMIPSMPQIDAESYILIDYNSGKVLGRNECRLTPRPASLTKMMTSYVIGQAIKASKITPNNVVTVNKNA